MSATNQLRAEHDQIRRLEKIVSKCAEELYKGTEIPFSDIEKITIVISEFVDAIHFDLTGCYSLIYNKLKVLSTYYFSVL